MEVPTALCSFGALGVAITAHADAQTARSALAAAGLSGAWRALSFIGLGAILIASGYGYRALLGPSDGLPTGS